MAEPTEGLRSSERVLGLQEEIVGADLPDEGAVRRAPHKDPTTPGEWVRENLFSSPFNSVLTIVFGLLGLLLGYQVIRFIFFSGNWGVFQNNVGGYMTGRWPRDELWRIWTAVYAVALLSGLGLGIVNLRFDLSSKRKNITRVVIIAALLFVFVASVDTLLVYVLTLAIIGFIAAGIVIGRRLGGVLTRPLMIAWILAFPAIMVLFRGFDGVPPRLWGGFVLNLTVAFVAIFASFPIGLFLALGRRSTLPVIRFFSIGAIELIRGNPLYILLITGNFLFPLLLPPSFSDIPLIIRAMAIFTLFSSAYVAEIVRGGLQGVDDGQYEASRALGLSYTRMMALVILPQALRSTIPAMISHFISLFKDTSLLAVIGGFTDALRAARRASAGLGEAGNSLEALLPAALMFWVVAFSMSRWSQRVEKRVGVGER